MLVFRTCSLQIRKSIAEIIKIYATAIKTTYYQCQSISAPLRVSKPNKLAQTNLSGPMIQKLSILMEIKAVLSEVAKEWAVRIRDKGARRGRGRRFHRPEFYSHSDWLDGNFKLAQPWDAICVYGTANFNLKIQVKRS